MDDYDINFKKSQEGIEATVKNNVTKETLTFTTSSVQFPIQVLKDVQAFIAELTSE